MRPPGSARAIKTFVFLSVLAAGAFPLSSARAASCEALTAELRRLGSASPARSPAAQKWSTAKQQQQGAISAAERDARYFGCEGSAGSNCKAINGKLKRMKANLAAINRQLAKAGGGSTRQAQRIAKVRASLARQKCDARTGRQARSSGTESSAEQQSLLQRLFGKEPRPDKSSTGRRTREIATTRPSRSTGRSPRRLSLPSGGTFRTLCVRACDGYFFPVSFSAGKDQFVNDAARCSEICPAAETELYVYRNPGGNQSEMMSMSGMLYSEEPFAYRYRSELVDGCSCRATREATTRSAWQEVTAARGGVFFADISAGIPHTSLSPSLGGTYQADDQTPSALSRPPMRKAQLPLYEDPDTLFNLEKGLDVQADLSLAQKRHEAPVDTASAGADAGLPLLSVRPVSEKAAEDIVSSSPVFKTDDAGFRPAPERKGPVRVVGPEYFVAQ
ncbi:DUF2865 domain-containing protein [Rhodobacterales bacterium]|nr:DUF2865 domain-containing protein [Rhodobacterales bacterium]